MGGGLLKPRHKILGDDIAGRVEAIGENVEQFQPGDEVFGISNFGAFAEYACAKEDLLVLKPASMTFAEAATIPFAAITALNGLRDKGQIQSEQKVLIVGASGGVGTFAVQIAKSFGAEVTGVCSARKLDMVRSIGADHVIDYTREDFTESGQHYDLILDIKAYRSISDYGRVLNPRGIYVLAGGSVLRILQTALTGNEKMHNFQARPNQRDLVLMTELLEAGKVVPVIDRHYPFNEVAEAVRYYGEGHARGKVIITI
jgi:NADPH:quinone reductase-like Zn-dependent oxidoreductase